MEENEPKQTQSLKSDCHIQIQDEAIIIYIQNTVPLPWKAPTIGGGHAFSSRSSYKRYIRMLLRRSYKGPILSGAFSLDVQFFLPIPESESEKKKVLMAEHKIKHTKKPDSTNLMKLHEDCLEGIILDNDSQVWDSRIRKYYALNPGIIIRIEKEAEGS